MFCVVPGNCDSIQCLPFAVCNPNISQALWYVICALLLPPCFLSLGVFLRAEVALACTLPQIQLWGEEVDFASYFSASHLRAKSCSREELLCGWNQSRTMPALGACWKRVLSSHREAWNLLWCLLRCYFVLQTLSPCPRDRSFHPLDSRIRRAEVERIVWLIKLIPSNSPNLANSGNVSWFYCIIVLGDIVLLFYQCYETSK